MSKSIKAKTITPTTEQKTPDITIQEVMQQIGITAFHIDFMKNPEDALLSYRVTSKENSEGEELNRRLFEKWETLSFERLIKIVAKKTGADPEQLRDPQRRTPEQQRAILEEGAREQAARVDLFFKSRYYQALCVLDEIEGNYQDQHENNNAYIGIKEQAALYFFATHKDIMPNETEPLTDKQKKELTALFYRMDKFYLNDTTQESGNEEIDGFNALIRFINSENKNPKEIIAVLQSVIPSKHIMANNSLMNEITSKKAINAGAFDLDVGKKRKLTAYTMVSYDQDKNEKGELILSKLTEYERQVSDAIITIWEESTKAGLPPEFTTDMVYRYMPGSGDRPSAQQAGAITRTIEKFRNLSIYIDITEEMRSRGVIPDNENLVFDDKYISAIRVKRKIKNGGQTVTAYHLHTEPLILTYCKMTKQLITVSPKLLEIKKVKKGKLTKEAVAMTQERQAITGYLLRRIAIMKRDRKNKKSVQSNIILFSTLFDAIGVTTPDKQKAADIRKFCFDVLEYYKAEKYITGYDKQIKGRSIAGIIIEL